MQAARLIVTQVYGTGVGVVAGVRWEIATDVGITEVRRAEFLIQTFDRVIRTESRVGVAGVGGTFVPV
jgi:hypothetical protein